MSEQFISDLIRNFILEKRIFKMSLTDAFNDVRLKKNPWEIILK